MIGIIGIIMLIVLIFLGMNIGVCMLVVGFFGFAAAVNFPAAFGLLKTVPFPTVANFNLFIIPLFILMGQFSFHAGISSDLYKASYTILGRLKGGLALATIGACALFSAVSGSSAATAATMGTVCLPEMRKYKYKDTLSTGCLAAGGTLGILIPPSVGFVLYGVATGNSIGALFAAGLIPGILLTVFFWITAALICWRDPDAGPQGEKFTAIEKLKSLKNVWMMLVLFIVVIGGIFAGFYTANEGSAIGAFGAFLFMVFRKKCTWTLLKKALYDTIKTSAMVLFIILGAYVFGYFLTITRIPMEMARVVAMMEVPPFVVVTLILLIYFLISTVMDSLACLLLLVPIFYPLVVALGLDPIWFGVLMVMLMQVGTITPPVGINVFVIVGIAKDIPMYTVFRGVIPFIAALLCATAVIIAVPQVAVWLPNFLYY